MFWKRKKPLTLPEDRPLYECNPAELDLEMLHHLQAGLIAKLVIANREVVQRYEQALAQSGDTNDKRVQELAKRTERLKNITTILEVELGRFQEGFQQPTRH